MPDSAARDAHSIDFKAIRHRFTRLNQARLERARGFLRERQREFLDVLPLLFHVNYALFPGFVSKDVPAGITEYEPSRAALEIGKRMARSFSYKPSPRHQRHFPVLALYAMGSAGSIAYADDSDFDIWICHDTELSSDARMRLQQKAAAIEQWAAELGVEAHFYLVDVERFRSGDLLPLSGNSSGSAQRHLLLDEFYRTSILLAGLPPLWWVVPPAQEADYDSYARELKERRFPYARGLLDFGGLMAIPAEEFLGAALWHLYKSIDSPYKSALKLLLIESYAHDYPLSDMASLRYKQAVYGGENSLDRLDPYLLMLQKASEYLQTMDDAPRLEFARRAFYLKTGERLSEAATEETWQRGLLRTLAEDWGWQPLDVQLLDRRADWKVVQVAEERRTVFKMLSTSYRLLSDFARRHAELTLISQRDLTILGRKLYAAFERKAGKVELLNRGINANLNVAAVTLLELLDGEQQAGWQLYQGALPRSELTRVAPLKHARNVIELLAWAYFNGIIDRLSTLLVHARITQLVPGDLRLILEHMQSVFPPSSLETRSLEEYATPARIMNAALYLNGELDSFTALSLGETISSSHTDALSYGGTNKNLVQSLDLVIVSSWREVLTRHFRGGKGLMEFLREYFSWAPPSGAEAPPELQIFGTSAQRGHAAAQRIKSLLADLLAAWYGAQAQPDARYLLTVGRSYYLLFFQEDTLWYEQLDSDSSLQAALAQSTEHFRPLIFDAQTLQDSLLPLIYSHNRSGQIQFFYMPQGDRVEVYVLDERGSLFHERTPFFDGATLTSQYMRFFDATINRIGFLMQEGQQSCIPEGIEFFLLARDNRNVFCAQKQAQPHSPTLQNYLSLQVIIDHDENGNTLFTLYCAEREFSALEYGDELFSAVVRHVLELRRSGQPYPIYITDISLSRSILGDQNINKMQTLHFLNYKRRIERELNKVLESSVSTA